MGDFAIMDQEFIKLDLLCGDLQSQINDLYRKCVKLEEQNKMLEDECNALRQQLKYAESQVYNGSTM
jgi:peptidoglycan hydrolase CwlO-like protein